MSTTGYSDLSKKNRERAEHLAVLEQRMLAHRRDTVIVAAVCLIAGYIVQQQSGNAMYGTFLASILGIMTYSAHRICVTIVSSEFDRVLHEFDGDLTELSEILAMRRAAKRIRR